MQRNDKKIKELLKKHICKRPYSPGNPAGLYRGVATPSRVCRTRQGFVFCSCIFHLWQQSWTPMYSSRNCKADPAKQSMFLRIAYQPHIRSSQEKKLLRSIKNRIKITNLFTLESKRKDLGMESRQDIGGMASHTKCSRLYCVHTGWVVFKACSTCFTASRTHLYVGNTSSDTCPHGCAVWACISRYCPHTRSYSGSKSILSSRYPTRHITTKTDCYPDPTGANIQ